MPNRLAAEPSPYLQQHKDNPVEWWPWGEAAFAEARRRDVPVFVSIGYATCHWCHVMAHESFEDPGVARLMNEAFVNVKVDREERPDVDEAYMRVCQALTGSGGWPLNVVVTPDKKPFYAATYVPKTARFGRIGMMDLVPRLRAAWEEQREAVVHRATHIVEALAKEAPQSGPLPDAAAVADVVAGALDGLAARFDPVQGGFGGPPKFPSPQVLRFLLHVHARGGAPDDRALRMARTTLDAMARGGIRDHLGGGFHRYSTDAHWLVPHFEKMLYDQAMLLLAYAEAHAAAPRPEYREVVEDVVSYLERDLRHREGAFFSAEDADSEGEEGRFYTWTAQEIGPLLRRDVDLFLDAFGVRGEGNFHDEASGRPTGRNILHRPRPLAEVAAAHGLDEAQARSRLEDRRAQLLNARQERVRPLRDEKVLTDWNGLAVAALARASVCLGEPRFAARAAEAARFVLGRMHADGRLRHRWKDGRTDDDAFLDDHAFLLWGLVELHQATQEAAWLEAAVGVADALLERFEDPEGGFRTAPRGGELLPVRPLDAYDGALPSGNSVAVEALWRLGRLTGRTAYEQAAWRTVGRFAGDLVRHPAAFTGMLVGLQAALDAPREVVVAGPRGDAATLRLLEAVRPALGPGTALLLHDPDEPGLARLCPWLAGYGPVGGRPAAYVCRDHACERPVTDPARLAAALTSAPAAPTAPAR